MGEDDLDAVGDQACDGVHGGGDRPLLRLDGRRAVGAGHGVAAEGDDETHATNLGAYDGAGTGEDRQRDAVDPSDFDQQGRTRSPRPGTAD